MFPIFAGEGLKRSLGKFRKIRESPVSAGQYAIVPDGFKFGSLSGLSYAVN